jgi:hypothetical protein
MQCACRYAHPQSNQEEASGKHNMRNILLKNVSRSWEPYSLRILQILLLVIKYKKNACYLNVAG